MTEIETEPPPTRRERARAVLVVAARLYLISAVAFFLFVFSGVSVSHMEDEFSKTVIGLYRVANPPAPDGAASRGAPAPTAPSAPGDSTRVALPAAVAPPAR